MLIQRLSQFGGKAGSEHVEGGLWLGSIEVEASEKSTTARAEERLEPLSWLPCATTVAGGHRIVPSYRCSVMVARLGRG
jgi:hypothetical protein